MRQPLLGAPNKADAQNPAMTLLFQSGRLRRGVCDLRRYAACPHAHGSCGKLATMKARWVVLALALAMTGFIVWASGALAGKPCLPLSDAKGTERVFMASESEMGSAITNAFHFFKFHDLMLTDAIGSDWMAPNWHPTNGFLLIPTTSTIGTVPTAGVLGRRQLPYLATFHVTVRPVATNQMLVAVRTVTAKVVDGITLGHAGTTGNTVAVPPVRQQEEKVLAAIADELTSQKIARP